MRHTVFPYQRSVLRERTQHIIQKLNSLKWCLNIRLLCHVAKNFTLKRLAYYIIFHYRCVGQFKG